ncbi:hypothetical protein ABZP36_029683 [Zizania latifolia]
MTAVAIRTVGDATILCTKHGQRAAGGGTFLPKALVVVLLLSFSPNQPPPQIRAAISQATPRQQTDRLGSGKWKCTWRRRGQKRSLTTYLFVTLPWEGRARQSGWSSSARGSKARGGGGGGQEGLKEVKISI